MGLSRSSCTRLVRRYQDLHQARAHCQGEIMRAPERQRVLVTGATGYVGGRLVPLLLARGYRVRVLARDRDRLEGRSWIDQVELVLGDVLDPATLPAALDRVDAAYY